MANTQYIKNTKYYQTKLKQYKILSNTIKIFSIICIIMTSILIARPVTYENKSNEKYNRDIIISLDISTSQTKVNLELIKRLQETLPGIKGDRIGIVIFNTAPVVYCPLTDDYDYINDCLNTITEQLNVAKKNGGYPPVTYKANGKDVPTLWYGGVASNSETRGSSLVGDGLAGTVYSFPDIEKNKDRTRIIVFATDNDVQGKEVISLEDACTMCKEKGAILYAYCPSTSINKNATTTKISAYKDAIEKNASGNFYTGNLQETMSNIFEEIKNTKTSLLQTSKKTYETDNPEKIFIGIIIVFIIKTVIEKRIGL